MINFSNPSSDPSSWDSRESLDVRESGLGDMPTPDVDPTSREALPAGGGRWPVPPHLGFSSLINAASRSHLPTIDEAIRHSRPNAAAMRHDPVIEIPLERRFDKASQVSWIINPLDETDNFQIREAIRNTASVAKTPQLQDLFKTLHWAKFYGKMGAQLTYRWDAYDPSLMTVHDWTPINGDSLVPRWANNDWGISVNGQYPGEKTGSAGHGLVHWFTPEEMESIIVHSWGRTQPDYYDGTASGAVRGRGLRHPAYWPWFCRMNLLALAIRYSERLAFGVWKGYYDNSNPEARLDLERAVAAYEANSMLSLPKNRDGSVPNDLVIMEVGSAPASFIQNLIDYFERLLWSLLSGRDSLSGSVGGDEVSLHEGAVSLVTKSDATTLAEDLSRNWMPTLYKYNSRGCPPGRFTFETDSPNAEKLLNYAVTMRELGWGVNLDHLAKICGLPPGTLNQTVSTKIQPLQPVAVQSAPQNVPMATGQPAPPPTSTPTPETSAPNGPTST